MNLESSIETTVTRVVRAPMMIRRLFSTLGHKVWSTWRSLVKPKDKKRDDPDAGLHGAGVPARLRPPPPVLFSAAARSFPEPDEEDAA